jgi:hypothetical protein
VELYHGIPSLPARTKSVLYTNNRDDVTHLRDTFRKPCTRLITADADLLSSFFSCLVSLFFEFLLSRLTYDTTRRCKKRKAANLDSYMRRTRGSRNNGLGFSECHEILYLLICFSAQILANPLIQRFLYISCFGDHPWTRQCCRKCGDLLESEILIKEAARYF